MSATNLLASDADPISEIVAFVFRKVFNYATAGWTEQQQLVALAVLGIVIACGLSAGYLVARRRSRRTSESSTPVLSEDPMDEFE